MTELAQYTTCFTSYRMFNSFYIVTCLFTFGVAWPVRFSKYVVWFILLIVALISVVNYRRLFFIAMPGPSRATDEVEEDECDTEDELRKYESSINSTTIIDMVCNSLDGIVEHNSLVISCTI